MGPRGHPASRGCPGWSRGPSGTACGGGDLSMLLDKGLGIHQMATVDASANSIFFFFFFGHFIKLLNPIKHVVYFTSRHLLLSSSSPSQAAERGSHVRWMGALGACRWWGGSLGTMSPAASPRCPGLASRQQGQMDTPALSPPPPLHQGCAPGPCDPRAMSRVLSHGVWIMYFCSAPKIAPCRPGRRRADGPCRELLALPRFCCWGTVSSHRHGSRALCDPYITSRSMGRAQLPCCQAGGL